MYASTRKDTGHPCSDAVPLRTAREALSQRQYRSVVVEENENVALSPENEELFDCFSRVPVTRYRDLQYLGLVPRNLEETAIRKAISADDKAAYAYARSETRHDHSTPCTCSCAPTKSFAGDAGSKDATFETARAFHNYALADVLSEHYGTTIAAHSPTPELVRKWAVGVELARYPPIYVAALEDIRIKARAKLNVSHKAKALMARNIFIHETGQMACPGAFIRIEAASIQSFTIQVEVLKVYTDAKWQLALS